jgi:methyltransferase
MRPVLLSLLVFVPMIVEARRAARHERVLRQAGGVEPRGDVYPLMRVAYPAAFLAMIAESAVDTPTTAVVRGAGACVFVLAKALKWWAIGTLGTCWTFRVIVVPGRRLVRTGPYRYLRHPNYVAVVAELVGVALLTVARVSGPVMTLLFVALIMRRVVVENRALAAAHPGSSTGRHTAPAPRGQQI